ncbi:MAG: ComEC/Rec2 family competence protein [Verrucomicrobiota bacterium]
MDIFGSIEYRPAPLFFAAWFALLGLLLAWFFSEFGFLWSLLLVTLIAVSFFQKKFRWAWGFVIAILFLWYGGYRYHHVPKYDLRQITHEWPASVKLRLIPQEEPVWKTHVRGYSTANMVCRVEAIDLGSGWSQARGDIWVRMRGQPNEMRFYGNVAEVAGYLEAPKLAEGPGQIDFRRYLNSRDIHFVFSTHLRDWNSTGIFSGLEIWSISHGLRDYMLEVLGWGSGEEAPWASLMAGMLFGYRDGISSELWHEFTVTGTVHLFAVSGQNVGMILIVFVLFLRLLGLIRWRWAWVLGPFLLLFCLSTGMESSAARAWVMIMFILMAWLIHRPVTPLNILGLAALLLWVWNPFQLVDVGFALSFLVLLMLLIAAKPLALYLYGFLAPDPFIPALRLPWWRSGFDWIYRNGCVLFSASIVAWLGSLPLILWHFGLIAPVTVLSNCIVAPLAGTIVVLAVCSVLVGWVISPLSVLINILNAKVLEVMVTAVSLLAAIPHGHFYISQDDPLASGEFCLSIVDQSVTAPAILQTKRSSYLINAGSERGWIYQTNPVRQYLGLEKWNAIFLTQAGARQMGGVFNVLNMTSVDQVYQFPHPARTKTFRVWKEHSKSLSDIRSLSQGDRIVLEDGSFLDVLWPPKDAVDLNSENGGLVLKWTLSGVTILWASNIGASIEAQLISSISQGEIDVLIQGSHSRENNLSVSWLEKMQPVKIVRPDSGFYPDRALTRSKRRIIDELGIDIVELRRVGFIQLRGGSGRLRVRHWSPELGTFLDETACQN